MPTQIQRLAQMGAGNEILLSVHERSRIRAAISNARTFFKYCKDGVKSGMFKDPEESWVYIDKYYKELLAIEHLAHKYSFLHLEDFCKIKLQIEKFFKI